MAQLVKYDSSSGGSSNSSSSNSSSSGSSSNSSDDTLPPPPPNPNHNPAHAITLHKLFKYDISLICSDMVCVVNEVVKGLLDMGYEVSYQPMDAIDLRSTNGGSRGSCSSNSSSSCISSSNNSISSGSDNMSAVYDYIHLVDRIIDTDTVLDSKDHISTSSNSNNCGNASIGSKILLEVFNYGHIGDNNLHLNILLRPQAVQIQQHTTDTTNNSTTNTISTSTIPNSTKYLDIDSNKYSITSSIRDTIYQLIYHDIDELVYKHVIDRNGSISAEHGIGQLKRSGLIQSKGYGYCNSNSNSTGELNMMKTMKIALDPKNIMNSGKIF